MQSPIACRSAYALSTATRLVAVFCIVSGAGNSEFDLERRGHVTLSSAHLHHATLAVSASRRHADC
jgi:hypothetical protein